MGFFKDFKDDFSQALSELLPGDDFTEDDEFQVNTLDNELDVEKELSKLDGLLEQVEKKSGQTVSANVQPELELRPLDEVEAEAAAGSEMLQEPEETLVTEAAIEPEESAQTETESETVQEAEEEAEPEAVQEPERKAEPEAVQELELKAEPEAVQELELKAEPEAVQELELKAESEAVQEPELKAEPEVKAEPVIEPEEEVEPEIQAGAEPAAADAPEVYTQIKTELNNTQVKNNIKEEKTMDTMDTTVTAATEIAAEVAVETAPPVPAAGEVTDEVSIITAGTSIKGNMETTGSFEIEGRIEGDIKCNGKLTVIGTVVGNSASSEFFADAAHIEGEVVSSGTVKVGLGSVIIGNITATSAVIAGAVKGDIDVQGPVVVDTSAVIMGNIKSRSVQINNGAVIEGFCSQCYSDVDVESLFNKNK